MFDGANMHVVKTNTVDDVINFVKTMSDIQHDQVDKSTYRYIGSIDPVTAANFRKESGYKIGTKEFARYAKRRLNDDYTKFRA